MTVCMYSHTHTHTNYTHILHTQIKSHAGKDDESKEVVECCYEVDNSYDDVRNGGEDLKDNVAGKKNKNNYT